MPVFLDLTGEIFGRLTALEPTRRRTGAGKQLVFWRCQCVCGKETFVMTWALRSGGTSSCGCLQREKARVTGWRNVRHGRCSSPEYKSWRSMLTRCLNLNEIHYPHYGGRGITVCARWRSFHAFYADMGPRPFGTSLERINVDGNYELSNCRWATWSEQRINQRRKTRREAA